MSSVGVIIDPRILDELFGVDTLPADLIIPQKVPSTEKLIIPVIIWEMELPTLGKP
ncbi:hypothetical protein [Limnospira platensis]|uniref:hypothetical protein n=1 Tax=Limnospira platensis TaxID=118562 RepID=UPI0021A9F08C|nr:hypothetical protein APLC1_3402 [Arthrospira platensis C1]